MLARTSLVVSIFFLTTSSARADGLIYSLPPDGSWVTFMFEQNGTEIKTLAGEDLPDVNVSGTFTIRSVGQEESDTGSARWIELEARYRPDEQRPVGRVIILRMLIPESSLARDSDPLSDVREIDFIDKDWKLGQEPEKGKQERVNDPAAVLYEIERFRGFFPFPPVDAQSYSEKKNVRISVPIAECETTKISYPTKFEGKLTRGKLGRWGWEGTYSLWLSETSPFGVVAAETITEVEEEYGSADAERNGVQMKSRLRLDLKSVGIDAKSAFDVTPNDRITK